MKKRVIALLLVTVMAIACLTACGGKKGDGKIHVGVINNDPSESGYRTANVNDLKKMFGDDNTNNYVGQFFYSLKNDEQIEAAKKMITEGVDYLLLSAADTAGWDGVLKDAKKAGVKVILFDRTIDASNDLYESSIVSDMAKEGQMAVDWLATQNLAEYNIIHIQGGMGSARQKGRTGALDTKVPAEANWNMVVQQSATWDENEATKIVKAAIDAGKKFNVIYAENDGMAKGAMKALGDAGISHGVGKDVIIIGFDCNKWALQYLKDGLWNYDGQCNPFQAQYLHDIIQKLEKGEKVDKQIIMDEKGFDATKITDDDVNKYGI